MSYTKHYYIGSERVSAKTGTVRQLGMYDGYSVLPTVMPGLPANIRTLSTATVNEAGATVVSVYNKFQLTPPTLSPIVEADRPDFTHDQPLNIFYFHPDHLGSSSYITNQDGKASQHMEYLPFGETMVDEHTNSISTPFKFNGKEYDEETGNYYYGARYYDPKWSIWISVDPMVEKTLDTYGYCHSNPINLIDPDGALPWPIHIRSFISTATAGGGSFRGDGRGPSTLKSPQATSRLASSFIVDPAKGTASNLVSKSDPTIFYGAGNPIVPGPYLPPKAKSAEPSSSITNVTKDKNAVSLDFAHSAKDPITPGFATPDLDVQASLDIIENLEGGMLSVTGRFTGDAFPSTEAFIEDQSGNRLLLGAHKEEGGLTNLFGENKRETFTVNMIIRIDKKGNFTGVEHGDKTYSVNQWNNKVKDSF